MTFSRDRLTRATITLPDDLIREVDNIAGRRGRSRYIADAVVQRIRRDQIAAALTETEGVMKDRPGAMTPEETLQWIGELRSEVTT